MLKTLAVEDRTFIILYESPLHKLVKTLHELATALGPDRQAAVCRETYKNIFRETNKNSLSALAMHYESHPPKGEIVIVIAPTPDP